MARPCFDVGIVIPLMEEFRYVVEIAPQLEIISHGGTYFYRLDFGACSAVCCISGRMGPLPALQAATRLLAFADVKLIVVLGLGGALDNDVSVGDVVIAEEVNEFQANSKAEASGKTYEVRYSGRHWTLDYAIREAVGHFEFAGGQAFTNWQSEVSDQYQNLEIENKDKVCSLPSSIHLGPIASGNVVAASTAFVDEVKRINRKFVAIDMEAAGVAVAASERIHPLPCLVVRGISDYADEGKKNLDDQSKGAWRRYCVKNAASFVRHVLSWEGFQEACGLRMSPGQEQGRFIAGDLAGRLKSCVGGPWIVGIAFGVYFHGPRIVEGDSVVPMDVSRLRIIDTTLGDLIDSAKTAIDTLHQSDDIALAADQLGSLVADYRQRLNSSEAEALLADFDGVVIETLCPEDNDQDLEAVILEAERLEQEVGPDAVVELLGGLVEQQPRLRERFVDALSNLDRLPEIVSALASVTPNQLSRREVENLITAYVNTAELPLARDMMRLHASKYVDRGALLYRQQLATQHPELSSCSDGAEP